MKKVAILGGSFNPITKGHVEMAHCVLSDTDTQEVWIMPCYGHRLKEEMVSSEHRLAMCKEAIKWHDSILVSDYEIRNKMDGSVYDLICRLKVDFPDIDFSFIIGMDNVVIFDKWKNHDLLKKETRFIVLPRYGVLPPKSTRWYCSPPHIYLEWQHPMMVSSTEIRNILLKWHGEELDAHDAKELSLKFNMNVLKYIHDHSLYVNK